MNHLNTDLVLSCDQAEVVLADWLGATVRCTGVERLHGGMINSVLRLSFDRAPHTAVIKLSSEGKSFAGEARALRYLHARGFPCPEVYLEREDAELIPYAFLLLETLPGRSLAHGYLPEPDQDRVERELAEVLVALHQHKRGTFGGIGGEGEERWLDVFMPRLHRVRAEPEVQQRLPSDVLRDVDHAIEAAEALLQDQGQPTLIHGDIWAANVIVHKVNGHWHLSGLVDPGAQYADVEMELAYLRVFNTAGAAFFDVYTRHHPLRPGYELRWLVYWLRTYLVHVWLFGDQHYRDMTALVAGEIVSRTP
ncbi:MAG: fructosamine kinase family protein [Anaerolineae bacterium]